MNLKEFTFLTDENIHPDIVSYLRDNNYDVTDVKESGLTGKSDSFLIKFAFKIQEALLR